jgi:hypothetical protein
MARVLGSVVVGGRARAFVYESETGALKLDEFAPGPTAPSLDVQALTLLAARAGPLQAVRVGEYFCDTCAHWKSATKEQWSVGLCLSCSLDRASDLSDELDDSR